MTERAASSTAVLVCQGRASADGRYAVGRFHDPIAGELLDPAEMRLVEAVRAGRRPTGGADRVAYEMVRRAGLTMVPRTIAIDEAVREQPAGQVVILGAGLDGRAWRMPELARVTVFEVDHDASQQDLRRRLGGRATTAGRLAFVSVDLAHEKLGPAMESAGFDRQVETTWIWEGVIPYLTAGAVTSTVAQLAELSAPGSRLVVNYQAASVPLYLVRGVMRLMLRLSRFPDPLAREPWRSLWRPARMRRLLRDNGFEVTADSDLFALSSGLDLPGGTGASLHNGRVAVAVRR